MPRPTERAISAALNRTLKVAEPMPSDGTTPVVEILLEDLHTFRDLALARGDDRPQESLLGMLDLLDRDSVTFAGLDRTRVSFGRKVWDRLGTPKSLFFDIRKNPAGEN